MGGSSSTSPVVKEKKKRKKGDLRHPPEGDSIGEPQDRFRNPPLRVRTLHREVADFNSQSFSYTNESRLPLSRAKVRKNLPQPPTSGKREREKPSEPLKKKRGGEKNAVRLDSPTTVQWEKRSLQPVNQPNKHYQERRKEKTAA